MQNSCFFVGSTGNPLAKTTVHWTFQRLRKHLGWVARGSHPAPRIHDLRHTFICRRVQLWHEQGTDIDNAMLALATYVGHAKVSDTYWYLTGVPELMAVAGRNFEDFVSSNGRWIHA
jgi:integrase